MQTTFRRLAEEDVSRFRPWYTMPALKIAGAMILAAVLIQWITS